VPRRRTITGRRRHTDKGRLHRRQKPERWHRPVAQERVPNNHLVDLREEPPCVLLTPLILLVKLLDQHSFLDPYPVNKQWNNQ